MLINYLEVISKYINYFVLRIRTNKPARRSPERVRGFWEYWPIGSPLSCCRSPASRPRSERRLSCTKFVIYLLLLMCYCGYCCRSVCCYSCRRSLCCYSCCRRCFVLLYLLISLLLARRYCCCCCCCWSIVVHRTWLITFLCHRGDRRVRDEL